MPPSRACHTTLDLSDMEHNSHRAHSGWSASVTPGPYPASSEDLPRSGSSLDPPFYYLRHYATNSVGYPCCGVSMVAIYYYDDSLPHNVRSIKALASVVR